jgi:hypothetical protein
MADEDVAKEILAIVASWTSDLDKDKVVVGQVAHDPVLRAKRYLIASFVVEGLPVLQRVVSDQEPVLTLLRDLASRASVNPVVRSRAMRAIAENPAALEKRRAIALEVISARPGGGMYGCAPLVELLDASIFPTLRELVRASEGPDDFHFLAAYILADSGDQEILPDLRSWHPRLL